MTMATALPAFKSLPLPIIQLSLAAVLKCGQSFRWSIVPVNENTEYRLCLRDRVVCLQQNPTTLLYRSVYPDPQPNATQLAIKDAETLCWLKDYFQLDVDLAVLYKDWAQRDPVFARLQSRFEGIRILRQDPWENLISFICSSNNNISRITKMVQNLCTHYSPRLLSFSGEENATFHPFPLPAALAQPSVATALRSLGFGYRADFIQRTAKMLVDEHTVTPNAPEMWLAGLRKKTTDEARKELLKFVGVGRKVADCILLMSLDKKEVIPVDTHVYQIAVKHYGVKSAGASGKKVTMSPQLYDDVNSKLFKVWGDYAGWAHSVLFTADLKSFSSYGLIPPASIQVPSPTKDRLLLPTPPLTPSPSPTKRIRLESEADTKTVGDDAMPAFAEQAKRRRRMN